MFLRSPIHTSKSTQLFIENNCPASVIDWPSKGADMNPIENIWAGIQKSVSKEIRKNKADDREKLWSFILNSWEALDDTDIVENLYRSMPNRIRLVIQNGGHWTKY